MKDYFVNIREVHISKRKIKANSKEEALSIIVDGIEEGEEVLCEYSHTLDSDTWTVDE